MDKGDLVNKAKRGEKKRREGVVKEIERKRNNRIMQITN